MEPVIVNQNSLPVRLYCHDLHDTAISTQLNAYIQGHFVIL